MEFGKVIPDELSNINFTLPPDKEETSRILSNKVGKNFLFSPKISNSISHIRFVGNNLHPTDYIRVDYWVQRIKKWMESGIKRVYFFMHQTEEIHSPELSKYVIQQLNKHCDTNIPEPVFIKNN